jgi:serine phosphatase RsbU (regulator of sigma subunit)
VAGSGEPEAEGAKTAREAPGTPAAAQPEGPGRRIDAAAFRAAIAESAMFRGVPWAAVEPIVAACETREFAEGEVLLRAGQSNRSVALVLRGSLQVHLGEVGAGDAIEIPAGQFVGEMSVVGDGQASAHVVAGADCVLLVIDGDVFLQRALVVPGVARNAMIALANRIRKLDQVAIERLKSRLELERLHRELTLAHEIQMSMLPRESTLFPGRTDVDCAGRMLPALEVGGDFYDVLMLDAHRVLVAIGDVCGKGLAAAMLMMRTLTLLRGEAVGRGADPAQDVRHIVERINRRLCEGNDGALFVTLYVAILDTRSGTLAYVNAGHNPPCLIPRDGNAEFVELPRNPVAGVSPDIEYQAGSLQLGAGDRLVLYTDGVTEARSGSGGLFGEERLQALLDQVPVGSADALVSAAFDAVDAFAGGAAQSDDIAVVALSFSGAR